MISHQPYRSLLLLIVIHFMINHALNLPRANPLLFQTGATFAGFICSNSGVFCS